MKTLQNKNYWFASSYLLTFFAAWSMWWSFYAIWLKSTIGLSSTEVGMAYSINSAVSMGFMIVYGIVQDKLDLKKYAIAFQGTVMACIGPFLIYVYEPMLKQNVTMAIIVGAPVLSAGFISGCGLCESYVERISRRFNFEYGSTRFWGSFGYAVATFIAGLLFSKNPHINFYMSSFIGCLFLLTNFFFKSDAARQDGQIAVKTTPTASEIASLFGITKFWVLTLFVMGSFSLYQVYDQQLFPNFYTSFFAQDGSGFKIYGYLNSFQVFLEATMMLVMPFVIRKVGVKNAIILAAATMICRILGTAVFTNIYIISAFKLLHAIEIPLFVLAIFKYISLNFESRFSATLFSVSFVIAQQIGVIILSGPVGILFDKFGYSTTFFVLASSVAVVAFIGFFTLENDKAAESDEALVAELEG